MPEKQTFSRQIIRGYIERFYSNFLLFVPRSVYSSCGSVGCWLKTLVVTHKRAQQSIKYMFYYSPVQLGQLLLSDVHKISESHGYQCVVLLLSYKGD